MDLPDHGGTSADAYVLAVRGLAGRLERLGGRGVDEVKRRGALHLDRRARVMSEDEDRCVERRGGTPRAPPLPALGSPTGGGPSRTPDLRAPPRRGRPRESVGAAAAAARVGHPPAPPPA